VWEIFKPRVSHPKGIGNVCALYPKRKWGEKKMFSPGRLFEPLLSEDPVIPKNSPLERIWEIPKGLDSRI